MNEEIVMDVQNLRRDFRTQEKSAGLWQSVRGVVNRKFVITTAVHPTSFQVRKGELVGLVGANGAGKTTLLKMLSGLIFPSSGTARVAGFEPFRRHPSYLKKMSLLLGQKNQLWWDLAPLDSFKLLATIYDLDSKLAERRVDDLATLLQCQHVLKTQLRSLSLGERMKMEIIGALLHSPEVLFLDEPTIGLDIVAQTTIRKFLAQYVQERKPTVILTSHYMDDIAQLASRLMLISHGKIVYDGTVNGFINKSSPKHELRFSLLSPLTEPLKIANQLLPAGLQEYSLSLDSTQKAAAVALVAGLPGIENLTLEKANFEEIIHGFLEKESRPL